MHREAKNESPQDRSLLGKPDFERYAGIITNRWMNRHLKRDAKTRRETVRSERFRIPRYGGSGPEMTGKDRLAAMRFTRWGDALSMA